MIPLMPKELCNQSITLRLLDGHDKWQKPVFSEPITINHMIFNLKQCTAVVIIIGKW